MLICSQSEVAVTAQRALLVRQRLLNRIEANWELFPTFPAKELNHFILFTYILYLWLPSYYKYSIMSVFIFLYYTVSGNLRDWGQEEDQSILILIHSTSYTWRMEPSSYGKIYKLILNKEGLWIKTNWCDIFICNIVVI